MASELRTERLDFRLTSAQKRTIERAASLGGTSVTDFVVNEVLSAAIATIKEYESLELRDENCHVFVEALLNPPKSNETLKAAAARHKDLGL